jgi:copper chaperone NosL
MRPSVGVLWLALSAVACRGGGRPLVAWRDACEFCRMAIVDPRFGAELVTAQGRVRTFDSIECLASYVNASEAAPAPRAILVADFASARLVPVDSAVFVRSDSLHSPMGRALLAHVITGPAASPPAPDGVVLGWRDVLALMRDGLRPSSAMTTTVGS